MPLNFKDLKACWLVWYPTSVHGGCSYKREDLNTELSDKREESTWTTEKVIDDVEEYRKANNLRGKIKRHLRKLGAPVVPGTIMTVPFDREKELEDKKSDLRREVDAFNAESTYSTVRFQCHKHRLGGEGEDILKDMLRDLRETLGELKAAEQAADFKGITQVVQRLAGFDAVLPPSAADYLQRAIADARAQAKSIKASLEEKKEDLGAVQKRISTSAVDFARFAVMEPGSVLPDVDNDLVQRMMEAQSEERMAGVLFDEDDGNGGDGNAPDFASLANEGAWP